MNMTLQAVGARAQGHSQKSIATMRGGSSAAVNSQIQEHNNRIIKQGFCARCKRAGGEYFEITVARGKL